VPEKACLDVQGGDGAARPRILVVDDDVGIVRLLIEILKEMGDIHFSTSGVDAIQLARSIRPDAILLDIEMPNMDGFAVCAAIRDGLDFEDVPILFVTSHDDEGIEARALAAGAIDFVIKPLRPTIVRARVANYLTLKQRADQLRRLSTTDQLTGIANRRAFDATLEREWLRAGRTGEPLSLVMIDIDYFKAFNDTYGHQAGDVCLRAVAQTLAEKTRRPGDLAARYGGEEFVIVLPGCDSHQAFRLAEEIRNGVSAIEIPHAASLVAPYVSVSVGAVSMADVRCGPHDRRSPGTADDDHGGGPGDLVRLTDEALYRAKNAGRNRTVCETV